MKKLLLTSMAFFAMSFQIVLADGYIAAYSIKVSDAQSYAQSLDDLMTSKFGKEFPGTVTLGHFAFNGYDDATHVVVLNYDDVSSLGSGTESFSDPVFQSFFAKTSSMAEPVEQSLNMKLISGGNQDAENNQVYTIYRMQVSDPSSYAKQYYKLIKAQEDAGNIIGSYGLRQQVAGSVNYYSHYAYTSAPSVAEAMKSAETLYGSDSFAKFANKVGENRRVMNISILTNVVNYPAN